MGQVLTCHSDGSYLPYEHECDGPGLAGRVLRARPGISTAIAALYFGRAIVTPLAAEELHASGVALAVHSDRGEAPASAAWGCARIAAIPWSQCPAGPERDDVVLSSCPWWRKLTCRAGHARLANAWPGERAGRGGVLPGPGLVCCVANKVPGLRAVAVTTVGQAARATLTLGSEPAGGGDAGPDVLRGPADSAARCVGGAAVVSGRSGVYLAGAGRPCASLR